MEKPKDITFEELVGLLDQKRSGRSLIKIFSEEQYALDFAKGEVCIGTLQYYRSPENSEAGRSDSVESVSDPILKTVPNFLNGKSLFIQEDHALSGLAFCMFYYDSSKKSNRSNFRKSISYFGTYVAVIDYEYNNKFYGLLCRSSPVKSVSGKYKDLPTGLEGGNHDFVTYTDHPNFFGFQKRKAFRYQQEYRYIFSVKHWRKGNDAVDFISDRFIFRLPKPMKCHLFRIIAPFVSCCLLANKFNLIRFLGLCINCGDVRTLKDKCP